ncbi:protein-(glutamine-N5) methyltransferase, release factor-specific [Mycolicibacterium agri]|uniref:Release factor glutamine methyltransferase n=1 Tax=Mycolicibacterium agri TaxID=36811 RepID=A0A2A7MPX2_MYCAG|nr:peptide chain release factor N(5)-glutamine methyltransferase [Mycolicibacterium agri]PEG33619.1 protein-(glutamine-N5) methyltransferase, release factor-specific [Mycolicibacterium agri]GFG51421.1 release factor glutamine methyltransferase [Mycolicibacterium agri]
MRAARLRREIERAAAVLAAAGVESARIDAEELAAYAAGTTRGRLALIDDVDDDFCRRYADLVAQRSRRIPLQHIIGTAPLGPVTVEVGPGVFIPRPETELLLEWASTLQLPPQPLIVDLCTGTAALALALAKCRPDARVIAVDDDENALAYARRNIVDSPVQLVRADVTDATLLPELDGLVDLLVANPPYVPDGAVLETEVAQHDPPHAVFGGPDGMTVIKAIVALAGRWLKPGGRCAVEHDDTTSEVTVAAFTATGRFVDVTPRRDLAGRPRFVTATRGKLNS